jgi:hypothetical protein
MILNKPNITRQQDNPIACSRCNFRAPVMMDPPDAGQVGCRAPQVSETIRVDLMPLANYEHNVISLLSSSRQATIR